jgi:hypothetical protein
MSPKHLSPMIAILLILGSSVFGVLGGLHAIYTLLDLSNPRRLVPVDPSVMHAMANSALRLSRGGTDMWGAWIGFNFSHSLGLLRTQRSRRMNGPDREERRRSLERVRSRWPNRGVNNSGRQGLNWKWNYDIFVTSSRLGNNSGTPRIGRILSYS